MTRPRSAAIRENRQETKKPRKNRGFLEGWLKGFEPSTLRATI